MSMMILGIMHLEVTKMAIFVASRCIMPSLVLIRFISFDRDDSSVVETQKGDIFPMYATLTHASCLGNSDMILRLSPKQSSLTCI